MSFRWQASHSLKAFPVRHRDGAFAHHHHVTMPPNHRNAGAEMVNQTARFPVGAVRRNDDDVGDNEHGSHGDLYATENVGISARVAGVDRWWIRGWYYDHIRVCRWYGDHTQVWRCGNHRHCWPDPAPSKMSRRNTPVCFGSTTTGVRHSCSDVAHLECDSSQCQWMWFTGGSESDRTKKHLCDRQRPNV